MRRVARGTWAGGDQMLQRSRVTCEDCRGLCTLLTFEKAHWQIPGLDIRERDGVHVAQLWVGAWGNCSCGHRRRGESPGERSGEAWRAACRENRPDSRSSACSSGYGRPLLPALLQQPALCTGAQPGYPSLARRFLLCYLYNISPVTLFGC